MTPSLATLELDPASTTTVLAPYHRVNHRNLRASTRKRDRLKTLGEASSCPAVVPVWCMPLPMNGAQMADPEVEAEPEGVLSDAQGAELIAAIENVPDTHYEDPAPPFLTDIH